jgi:hypothetical protein
LGLGLGLCGLGLGLGLGSGIDSPPDPDRRLAGEVESPAVSKRSQVVIEAAIEQEAGLWWTTQNTHKTNTI